MHDASLVATRESLHRVAEHVLSAARKRAAGHQISLLPGPGGFRTPPFGDEGRVVAVMATDIAVIDAGGTRSQPLTSLRAAAEFVGIEPGFPWTKHPPATPLTPDEPLALDAGAARELADWFAVADQALRDLGAELAPDDEVIPQIFPEHFDVAITLAEVNYGASPGDEAIPVPYLYVGPHEPPGSDPFWNAAFGAYVTASDVATPADAIAFFRAGQQRLGRP